MFQVPFPGTGIRAPLVNEGVELFDFLFQAFAFSTHQGKRNFQVFLPVDQHFGARRKDSGENLAHSIAQLNITARFSRLALERVSLPVDFSQNVIHAGQILARGFQTRLGKLAFRLELGDSGRLFDQRPAVRRFRAEQLADTTLLDNGVAVRTETGAEEDFLNVAKAARFSIDEIHAFARPIQPPLNDDVLCLSL